MRATLRQNRIMHLEESKPKASTREMHQRGESEEAQEEKNAGRTRRGRRRKVGRSQTRGCCLMRLSSHLHPSASRPSLFWSRNFDPPLDNRVLITHSPLWTIEFASRTRLPPSP